MDSGNIGGLSSGISDDPNYTAADEGQELAERLIEDLLTLNRPDLARPVKYVLDELNNLKSQGWDAAITVAEQEQSA